MNESVPLWAFLVTTAVALFGPLATTYLNSRSQQLRDKEAHQHARHMWLLDAKRQVYAECMQQIHDIENRAGEVDFPSGVRIPDQEHLYLVGSDSVISAFNYFLEALEMDMNDLAKGLSDKGRILRASAVMQATTREDLRRTVDGRYTEELPASKVDALYATEKGMAIIPDASNTPKKGTSER